MTNKTTHITMSGGQSFRVYGDYEYLKNLRVRGGQRELLQVEIFDDFPPEPITIVADYVAAVSPASDKVQSG